MLVLTVADAIAAMDYLARRNLLCERCRLQLARLENGLHSVCVPCRPKHGEFREKVIPNKLEEGLCDAVNAWLKEQDAT